MQTIHTFLVNKLSLFVLFLLIMAQYTIMGMSVFGLFKPKLQTQVNEEIVKERKQLEKIMECHRKKILRSIHEKGIIPYNPVRQNIFYSSEQKQNSSSRLKVDPVSENFEKVNKEILKKHLKVPPFLVDKLLILTFDGTNNYALKDFDSYQPSTIIRTFLFQGKDRLFNIPLILLFNTVFFGADSSAVDSMFLAWAGLRQIQLKSKVVEVRKSLPNLLEDYKIFLKNPKKFLIATDLGAIASYIRWATEKKKISFSLFSEKFITNISKICLTVKMRYLDENQITQYSKQIFDYSLEHNEEPNIYEFVQALFNQPISRKMTRSRSTRSWRGTCKTKNRVSQLSNKGKKRIRSKSLIAWKRIQNGQVHKRSNKHKEKVTKKRNIQQYGKGIVTFKKS